VKPIRADVAPDQAGRYVVFLLGQRFATIAYWSARGWVIGAMKVQVEYFVPDRVPERPE
jgi:hypothetical protein